MKDPWKIAAVSVAPLDAPMNAPFAIATGTRTEVANILVRLRLAGGAWGFGEGAPIGYQGETQASSLKAARRAASALEGRSIEAYRPALAEIDRRLGAKQGSARAALSMAVLDAWCRRAAIPLRLLFGGAEDRVSTDVTVTLGTAAEAAAEARRILAMGIRVIKIKVGRDVEDDLGRVLAVAAQSRRLSLILDANCGFGARESLKLLAGLKKRGVVPAVFEQPCAAKDWKGLAAVHRLGRVDVAADESVTCRADALRMARERAAQVVNIKLMKYGLLEAWDIALICKAAGLGLMIGGMVESTLAMGCAAHFAAGLGGFRVVDLDTPLWFKESPMRGLEIQRGGLYDLSKVKAGIGAVPK